MSKDEIMVRLKRDVYKQLQQIKLDTDAKSISDVIKMIVANQKEK